MKKLLVLMIVLTMALSLAACGGSAEPDSDASTPVTSDVTLISKEANYTTLLVPSDFGEFYDKDGYAVAEGTNSSIIITPTIESDTRIEDINEDYMIQLLEGTYSNIKVQTFDNPVELAGVDAVTFLCTGDSKTGGKSRTVCYIMLFFSIDGQNCEQHLNFVYETGANTSLEANLTDIIESISLE